MPFGWEQKSYTNWTGFDNEFNCYLCKQYAISGLHSEQLKPALIKDLQILNMNNLYLNIYPAYVGMSYPVRNFKIKGNQYKYNYCYCKFMLQPGNKNYMV